MVQEPPKRIPASGGDEQDVFSYSRRYYPSLRRPGVCSAIKRKYNRRLRNLVRRILNREKQDVR